MSIVSASARGNKLDGNDMIWYVSRSDLDVTGRMTELGANRLCDFLRRLPRAT